MADITDDFSFAYLKEAFVATLLELARKHTLGNEDEENGGGDEDDPLDKYELWKEFKKEVKVLRDEMGSSKSAVNKAEQYHSAAEYEELLPLLEHASIRGTGESSPPCGEPPGARWWEAAGDERADRVPSAFFSPLASFRPLAAGKRSKLSDGAFEWGL